MCGRLYHISPASKNHFTYIKGGICALRRFLENAFEPQQCGDAKTKNVHTEKAGGAAEGNGRKGAADERRLSGIQGGEDFADTVSRQKQLLVQERGKVRQKLSLLHTKASLMDGQAERQNQLSSSALVQCADGGKLDACLVESLIEQIFIYQGKRAVIVWRWRDTAQKTQEGMHGKGSCDEALWNGGAG